MSDGVWTIRRMMDWMCDYLKDKGDEHPLVSTRWLLSDATGLTFMDLYVDADRPLSPGERDVLRENVKRRAVGEPLQYIVGKVGFRHVDILVEKGVLIPRPETEVLVSEVLSRLPASDRLSVVDLCTGSGCIACSIAYENRSTHVTATDISGQAVALARRNAEALDLGDRIEVIESDLGGAIDGALKGTIDAIVSNPPYIPSDVLAMLDDEVRDHEPDLALDGGPDGLEFFREIISWSSGFLKESGFLAVELFEESLDAAERIALDGGFGSCEKIDDLTGRPRVLIAWKQRPASSESASLDDGPWEANGRDEAHEREAGKDGFHGDR